MKFENKVGLMTTGNSEEIENDIIRWALETFDNFNKNNWEISIDLELTYKVKSKK